MTISPPHFVDTNTAVVFLLQATSTTEARLLQEWVHEHRPARGLNVDVVHLSRTSDRIPSALAARLSQGDDPLLFPLRVAWLPKERLGTRSARLRDALATGDPRHPRPAQQGVIIRRDPGRARVVCGEPASVSDLRKAFDATIGESLDPAPFTRFVARRATLALEREESHLLGPQYKVPRLVREEIWASVRVKTGLGRLARELGRPEDAVTAEAAGCLDEMVAGYGRSQIDVALRLGRFMYRQAYDEELDYDRDEADRVVALARHNAAVLLPTHRSNLDAGVMPSAWHDLRLPPTHTLAGINMAFWPLGPIMRRSGSIFIRRDIKSNPVYRFVLREYLGYLVEKRFHLEWYIEGGRSRTGKLLPPRLGLLTYVIDAYREGRAHDVILVPASITYDQLREVADFAGEARGEAKKKESIGWLVGLLRKSSTHYGKIYVRFGQPLSLRDVLGPPAGSAVIGRDERSVALQKIGFEVSWRINEATPITATALVTLALLGALGRAMTYEQVGVAARSHLEDAARRNLPLTASATALRSDEGMRSALNALVDKGVVVCCDDGPDTVYLIGPDQHMAAAFYRNSIIHHFLIGSIAQLALVSAAEPRVTDPVNQLWSAAMRLRDLLKFEFFFREKEEFRAAVDRELTWYEPDWQVQIAQGPPGIGGLLQGCRPLTAHLTLRAFLEAYSIVAMSLARLGDEGVSDERTFLIACAGLGRQRLLQRRILSPESVSHHLFKTGLQLASNFGLVEAGANLPGRRAAFAAELKHLLRQLAGIEEMALLDFKSLLTRNHS